MMRPTMKLVLTSYEIGPSRAEKEYVWINEVDQAEYSPIFDSEESAIMWYNAIKLYFCPNKNCTTQWLESNFDELAKDLMD